MSSEAVRLTIQVVLSVTFILGVLWVMFRVRGEPVTDHPAAPLLAFASIWLGVSAIGLGIFLWFTTNPDPWVVTTVLAYAAAISTGTLSLWVYRNTPPEMTSEPIQMQKQQARIGIALGLTSVALWYTFILTHKPILTPTG
ncbi:MAG: hypothetical protein D8M59_09115 [Planctomycetes bacterium]|nr:hypothetical protein [Planctomycetota bacterium]NOG54221.1 hypothetical protein [Planctomycetota bacterium]